jgi:hypothetical protein
MADVVLADLLAAQDGLLTRHQAVAAGMTDAALRHAARPGGPWRRLDRGLYAAFTGDLGLRQRLRAALLVAGPASVLSGAHACRAQGMRYVPDIEPPLALVPSAQRVAPSRLVAVRRTLALPSPRPLDGLPVAPVERAVVDACLGGTSLRDVRALVCESVQRRLTTPERLVGVLAVAPRHGSRLLRQAMADVLAGCRSAPECELRDLVLTSRVLPEPQWNKPLPDLPDVTPDGWWEEARLVVEVDSVEHHVIGPDAVDTQVRHARLAAAGWSVLPVGPRRLRAHPATVLLEMESAYRVGVARSPLPVVGRLWLP